MNSTRTVVVDLDGTLISSDLLVESIFVFLRATPLLFFKLILWLIGGKANLKQKLADDIAPCVDTLPYNQPLLVWLKALRADGARLVLATASDLRLAHGVANHLALFDEVLGTEDRNLAAGNKRDALVARYGKRGFEYVGNARADHAVWQMASVTHVANPDRGVLEEVMKLDRMGEVFDARASYFRVWCQAVRLHQWAKNLLIFVTLLAAHRLLEVPLFLNGLLAFLSFSTCASSVYLLNDLLDLQDDRQHRTKRFRPLAAGTFPVLHAMLWIPALLLLSFSAALLWLPLRFVLILLSYYALTLAYSLWLKRIVMLDVVTLALLYTVRVVAGAAAIGVAVTFWILAFCMFIFLSLAFVKRYTELYNAREQALTSKALGRGYVAADFELLASLGTAAGYLSVLVLALYINDSSAQALYTHPQWMWAACPLLLFWLSRVWLIAHRGDMHDDPIVFALRDRISQWIGLCFVTTFLLAALA